MSRLFLRFVREDEGQDLVEYAMLIALIALIAVTGVTTLGTAISAYYTVISTSAPLGGGS
jgi:pilus assembly protein Flp/PilA